MKSSQFSGYIWGSRPTDSDRSYIAYLAQVVMVSIPVQAFFFQSLFPRLLKVVFHSKFFHEKS